MDRSRPVAVTVRIALGFFAALFVAAAAVQFNDPDPWLWVAVYGLSALLCAAGAANHPPPTAVSAIWTILALAGAGYLAWMVFVSGEAQAMFPEKTTDPGLLDLEEAREMFGLMLVAASTMISAAWTRHTSQNS